MTRTMAFRNSALTVTGCLISMMILALAPTLLQQTAFDSGRTRLSQIRLIPMHDKELPETEVMNQEPEPPPEPEILPDPPDMPPPEVDLAEMEPPQTTYSTPGSNYSSTVQLPNLTGLRLKGVEVSGHSLNRKQAKTLLPTLPKHGPPRTRFNPDEVDQQPHGIVTMQPIYPYRAKRLNIQGSVHIRFLVNREGNTDLIKILHSEPLGEFDKTVKKTVKRWKFKPGVKDGHPVETWVETTIQFTLR